MPGTDRLGPRGRPRWPLENGQGLRVAPDRLAAHADKPVMIGIRPEHLVPCAEGEAEFSPRCGVGRDTRR